MSLARRPGEQQIDAMFSVEACPSIVSDLWRRTPVGILTFTADFVVDQAACDVLGDPGRVGSMILDIDINRSLIRVRCCHAQELVSRFPAELFHSLSETAWSTEEFGHT